MPYTIIVENDNSLYGSQKKRILQREKLFNKLWILVTPYYNGYDMSKKIDKQIKTNAKLHDTEIAKE